MTDEGIPVITQSMVTSFSQCPREFYYGYVLGLRPRMTSKPLTRGTWIHALLEAKANGDDWLPVHYAQLEKARQTMFDEEAESLAEECYNIMISYEYQYRNDPLTPVRAELTVERPMLGGRALYRGRIDLIVRDKDGDIWLVDHKTHQKFPDWNYRELAYQHYSYLWAAAKSPQYAELGIPQPKGFIYDYIRTGAIKVPTITVRGLVSRATPAAAQTYPVLRNWLLEREYMRVVNGQDVIIVQGSEGDYLRELLETTKESDQLDKFRRDELVFDSAQSIRQMKSFLTTCKRMLDYRWADPDCVERNLGACSSYLCNYRDLTTADLMHGTSAIEQRTRYVCAGDPLDYYPDRQKGQQQ